jgi:hypothetical protein
MSKLRKVPGVAQKKLFLLPEDVQSISDAAEFLGALVEKLPPGSLRNSARGHWAQLNYLAGLPSSKERFRIRIAIDYEIRKELSGPGNWKRARGETAEAHNVTDGTVSTYHARYRKAAHKSVEVEVAESADGTIKRTDALRALLHHLVHQAE